MSKIGNDSTDRKSHYLMLVRAKQHYEFARDGVPSDWKKDFDKCPSIYLLCGQSVECSLKSILYKYTKDWSLVKLNGHDLSSIFDEVRKFIQMDNINPSTIAHINSWFSNERNYDARYGERGAKTILDPNEVVEITENILKVAEKEISIERRSLSGS